jgi:hypothetical protein
MRPVMSEPLRLVASTISVPCVRPEITRLRIGKCSGFGGVPGANSVTSRPRSSMRWKRRAFERG